MRCAILPVLDRVLRGRCIGRLSISIVVPAVHSYIETISRLVELVTIEVESSGVEWRESSTLPIGCVGNP